MPELIERIQRAMDGAHMDWETDREDRGGGSAKVATRALKRRVWEMGFDYCCVYPKANELGDGADEFARAQLLARGVETSGPTHIGFTQSEFQYDVSWLEYYEEHQSADTLPRFKRAVLALECEFNRERHVLYDFDKLLCARADLRVMVWGSQFERGFAEVPEHLRSARGSDEGWWLLTSWGIDSPRHRVYHNGERIEELEATSEHARER